MSATHATDAPWIRLESVQFAYPGGSTVLREVDAHFAVGWHALVGANGSGKSTLLRMLASELAPTSGTVRTAAAVAIVHCPQGVGQCHDEVTSFGWAWDNHAQRLRADLKLELDSLERWPSLSPGERKRWQIAAALHARPDVLLLDEPTNHLDESARDLLADALAPFPGVGILVSHDRGLLDRLCERTLWIEDGVVQCFDAPYEVARELREVALATATTRLEQAHRVRDRSKRQLQHKRHANAAAERSRRSRTRMKGPRDHDARSAGAKARAAKAEASLGRDLEAMISRLARAEKALEQLKPRRQLGRSIRWEHEPARRNPLVRLETEELSVAGHTVLRELSLVLRPRSRVHLQGANGAGKTTLLTALATSPSWPDGRVLHLPQELDEHDVAGLFGELRSTPAEVRGRWLQLSAALGLDPEVALTTPSPSPGEARKLLIARGLAARAWCLLLDEPTNHLDLPSIERLEEALVDYPGALVLITHDERFAARCTDGVWRIENRRLIQHLPQAMP